MQMPKRCLLIACLLAGTLHAFNQPRQPLSYKVEMTTETIDSMELPRIRLKGDKDIQLDYIENFLIADAKDESLRLTHRYLTNNEMTLFVYPASSIRGGVTNQSVNDYLKRKSQDALRNEELFEIVTPPATNEGSPKMRFLGAKPITVEYVIEREIDGQDTRIMVQESWAELDDQVYLLRIEAPEDRFDTFYRLTKGMANSMYFIE